MADEEKGKIGGSNVVWDAGNDENTGALRSRRWLPGNPAVCYRPRRSRVHLGNVG
jgi:hypothetical protein